MKTLKYIEEDERGNVTGAIVDDAGKEVVINLPDEFPRAELATRARDLATSYGIALPANHAIPPADPPTP